MSPHSASKGAKHNERDENRDEQLSSPEQFIASK
jgi:hypothetical protein